MKGVTYEFYFKRHDDRIDLFMSKIVKGERFNWRDSKWVNIGNGVPAQPSVSLPNEPEFLHLIEKVIGYRETKKENS